MNREIMIQKKILFLSLVAGLLIFINEEAGSQDKNWTHFRGSNLDGISVSGNIPLIWDESSIIWKTDIHDKGWSSPVVYDNQIWLTSATPDGKELYAICTDFLTGKIIYDINVFSPDDVYGKHSINTYASPSPCIEKGFVYVHFGSMGTACINTDNGSVVWKRTDFKCNHVQGPASSPIIYKNMLILHFEGTDKRFIVALDKLTGKQIWRSDRPVEPYEPLPDIGKKAYITPIILNVKGRDMLISNGAAVCIAYDPYTGKEIWRVVRGAESTVAMPVTEKGILYMYTGFVVDDDGTNYSELIAVNPDGKGDITSTNILWSIRTGPQQLLTPVIKEGLIYTVDTQNNLMCIEAATGDILYSIHMKANFNASPVYLDGIIWFFSIKGEVLGVKQGRRYELVAHNQMDSGIWGTPAFLRNSVILRTDKYLYRIGK